MWISPIDLELLGELARTSAGLLRLNNGHLNRVARRIGWELLARRIEARVIEAHFGLKSGFPYLQVLLRIAREGVPRTVREGGASLKECFQYGNHPSLAEHTHVMFGKMKEDLWLAKILMFPRHFAQEICGFRVFPLLGAVITPKKLRGARSNFRLSGGESQGGEDFTDFGKRRSSLPVRGSATHPFPGAHCSATPVSNPPYLAKQKGLP